MILVNSRDKIDYKDGITVADILAIQKYDYVLITITVNSKYVPKENWDSFKVPNNAEVKVIHILHGG